MPVLENVLIRVKTRLKDENPDDEIIQDLVYTAIDRINLRVGDLILHPSLESIAVDISVKYFRRLYFEGLKDETADNMRTSFDDIMSEYNPEFSAYVRMKESEEHDGGKRVIRFL